MTYDQCFNTIVVKMTLNTSDVLYIIIAILLTTAILFGNGLTIVAVVRFHYLQTVTNKLLVSLAMSDIMAGLMLPLYAAIFFAPWLSTLKWFCLFRLVLILLSQTASIVNLLVISVDRYISIMYPLRYPNIMTSRNIYIAIVITWTHASLLSTAYLYWNEWDNISHTAKCIFTVLSSSGFFYSCIIVQLPLVLVVILSLYALIVKETKRHKRQIQTHITQNDHGVQNKRDYRTTKTLFIVLGLFYMCWTPFTITAIIFYFYRNVYNWNADHITFYLGVLNSCMNPFIYGWRNRNFRRAYRILLHRKVRAI